MAQPLRQISLVAPAFKGVNTEDSPLAQDPSFADVADNAVIDKRGRIAARKGHDVLTTDRSALGDGGDPEVFSPVRAIKQFKETNGTFTVFSAGNNKIMTGTTTLTAKTVASYTISADDWKIIDFNDKLYFFQENQEPLVYSTSGDLQKMSAVTGASLVTEIPKGHEVIGAYGRLWTATKNSSTVYWSDLLIGENWTEGTSGSINIAKVWPDGYDEIVALAAHNGLLIIFGGHSIVVYQGAESPATMTLADTVAGVGCVSRDTVQHTGTDVIFLSNNGLRSFGRTIQEKSMPVRTLSNTIAKDLIADVQAESSFFRSVYSPEENFYLISFVGRKITYCFDLRGPLEDGSLRVTKWPSSGFTCYERLEDGTLYIGTTSGISEYSGYQDNGESYRFRYYSPSLSFGDPTKLKVIKKISPTIVGTSNSSAFIKYGYDFNESYKNLTITIPNYGTIAEFGESASQFGVSEFSGASKQVFKKSFNASGAGSTVVVGLEADINGSELSLQEINILALIGKTL